MTAQRIHLQRAKSFYEILNETSPSLVTIIFDCQQNLVLPRLPDQATYYSRQYYMYNETVVDQREDKRLRPENVYFYTWLEHEFRKGSSEIASVIHHRLKSTDLNEIQRLRLASDGCGAQNKNSTMISMILWWFYHEAPSSLNFVEFLFPVVGHNFLPCDRVFGNIEKGIRKEEVIVKQEEYHNIIAKNAWKARMPSP